MAFLLPVSPLPTVHHLGGRVEVHSPSVLDAVDPLPVVDVAVGEFEDASAVLLAVEELSLVDMLIRDIL